MGSSADHEPVGELGEAIFDERPKDPPVYLRLGLDKVYKELSNRRQKNCSEAIVAWAAWRDRRPLSLGDVIKPMESVESDEDFQSVFPAWLVEENLWSNDIYESVP